MEDILFEPIDDATALVITQRIIEAIEAFEPRVILDFANTTIEPLPDDNRYNVTIAFKIKGLEEEQFEYRGTIP